MIRLICYRAIAALVRLAYIAGTMDLRAQRSFPLEGTTLLIERIFARHFGGNIASQHTLENAGFTLEAKRNGMRIKNGVVRDEWIYAIRRG